MRASRNLSRVSALLVLRFFSLFLLPSSSLKVQVLSRAWKPPPSPSPGLPFFPFRKHRCVRSCVEPRTAAPDENFIRGAVRRPCPREGCGLAGVVERGLEELQPTEAPRWSHLAQVISGAVGFQSTVSPRAERRLPRMDAIVRRTFSAHRQALTLRSPEISLFPALANLLH